MKSKVAERIMSKTPEDVKIFASLYAELMVRVNGILKEKGLTQKALAEKMDKTPSEIHKWLNSEHNFTLRSIAKLQAELGETLIEVPVRKTVAEFRGRYTKRTYSMNVIVEKELPEKTKIINWNYTPQTEYRNAV